MKKYVLAMAAVAFALQSFSSLSKDSYVRISKKEMSNSVALKEDKGKAIYTKTCVACHQATGLGIPSVFPPLAKSDYLNADVNRAIKQVIKGSSTPIVVNGKKYTTPMPAQILNDQEVADVLNYVYANWGNSKKVVTVAMVKAQRK